MPTFTTKLGTTYYLKKGRKTKSLPLICCHGGPGGTHHSLIPLLDLASDRQVVIFDQIGSGRSSDIPKSKWTIPTFVQNLYELINHLGFEKVILHGGSWGGTLILEFTKKYPDLVGGLIFHSSLISEKHWRKDAENYIKKLPKRTQDIIEFCQKYNATDAKVYKTAMDEYYLRHVCRDKSVYQQKKKSKRRFNSELYNHMWGPSEFCAPGALKGYNGQPILKKIKVPTLFICGQYDEATIKSAKIFAKQVKNAKVIEIKNASHSSLKEKPKETLKHLQQFLTKL